jgi:hypothetical protein
LRGDQAFVITDNGAYYGIATVLELLAEITRQQIHNARHANPLTLLPGSVPTNDLINRLLAEKKAFCVGYFDLDHWVDRCQAILSSFEHSVPGYYKAEHIEAGGIFSEDRHGCDHFFPLLSLSAGLVDAQATCLCQSHVDISDLACEAKKLAKKRPGNNYFINRRKPNNLLRSMVSSEFVEAIELISRN